MTTETKTLDELVGEVKAAQEASVNAVKAIAEEALGKAKSGEELASGVKEQADEALIKMNGLTEQLAEIEQKMARGNGASQPEAQKTFGEQFVESEGVKNFLAARPTKGQASIQLKASLTSATTAAAGSVGDAIAPTRRAGILELPQRRLTVRDLLSQGRMDGNTLEYVKQTGFTNNAAPVAEGAVKPSSDIQVDLMSTSAKVIAHWMKGSRQALDDISQLRSMVDEHLIYGLGYAEEVQLLNGDGLGQNLNGIIPQATTYAAPFTPSSPTAIDTMRLAMLQAGLAEYPATGHVMHPTDWARIELEKNAGGDYIIGVPQGTIGPTLWGLPVVATQAMAVDKFLTGAFRLGAQVFDRWDARIEVGYEGQDFIMNMVTVLAEERLALAVYRPEAFIYGDLGYVV